MGRLHGDRTAAADDDRWGGIRGGAAPEDRPQHRKAELSARAPVTMTDPFYQQKPEDRLGDAPLEHQYYADLAGALDELLNGQRGGPGRKLGFVLMIYPFDDHSGRCNYVSNGADRRDVVTLMKEMVARFSGQPEQKGLA